jgi:hypothetical protein
VTLSLEKEYKKPVHQTLEVLDVQVFGKATKPKRGWATFPALLEFTFSCIS